MRRSILEEKRTRLSPIEKILKSTIMTYELVDSERRFHDKSNKASGLILSNKLCWVNLNCTDL